MKMSNSSLIVDELNRLFPDANCELNYNKDYELLLSVMLSAQTTDKSVNIVTKDLYSKYDSLKKLSQLSINDVENYIRRIGFYKVKSKNFKEIVNKLLEIGYVPNDREYLETLPGVGRKTASVVLGHLYNEPNFAIDTHVFRVSKRLGITKEKDDILKTETKLKKYFNQKDWNKVNSQLVLFGRYICNSRKPLCDKCNLKEICKYYKKSIRN
jgi:endonuclease-3